MVKVSAEYTNQTSDMQPAADSGVDRTKVLVIDDEVGVRENLSEALTEEGFEVLAAPTAKVALELLDRIHPDLILCDVMMPDMDGLELLRTVRSRPDNYLTPFIFLSARSQRRDFRAGMDLGADDYLAKPWTIDGLLHVINTRLQRHRDWVEQATGRLSSLRDELSGRFPGELLGPLQGILKFSELLMDRGDNLQSGEFEAFAHDLHSGALGLLRRAENFLIMLDECADSAPSPYFGGTNVRSSEVTISLAAREVATSWARLNDLRVEVENLPLEIPSESLKKIIVEIVDNAFAYSQSGSAVLVSGERCDQEFRITVEDEGIGIGQSVVEFMNSLGQADGGVTEPHRVSGLAAVQYLTTQLGGHLAFRNDAIAGTVVLVSLPLPKLEPNSR